MQFTHKQIATINRWANHKEYDFSDSENLHFKALKRMAISKVDSITDMKILVAKIKSQKSGQMRSLVLLFIAKIRNYLDIKPIRKVVTMKKYRGIAKKPQRIYHGVASVIQIRTRKG